MAGPGGMKRLLDAVLAISSELDLAAMLRRIVESAVELSDATYGALGVIDDTGTRLSQFITVGIDDETHRKIGALPSGHGLLGVLIIDKKPLRLPNLAEHPDSYGFPPNHPPMTSFLGVPIRLRDQVYGNLYLTDKKSGEVFTDIDEELVVGLAGAAGIAIDNARLQTMVSELAVIEDRDRIGRDLHDSVIQRLFATGMSLHGTLSLVGRDPAAATARIQAAMEDLDLTVKLLRTTIFELEVSAPDQDSLRQHLLDVVHDCAGVLGFEPRVVLDGPIDTGVDPRVGVEVMAALREALSNVARHASATRVDVEVIVEGEVALTVSDDGVGPGTGSRAGGKGLANLATRAEKLGGTFEIRAEANGGTVVEFRVPKG
jgi:signal transduction histidine kinase